ncbi:hypothetical protein P7K49_008855, partial [Saguinus oedipus]
MAQGYGCWCHPEPPAVPVPAPPRQGPLSQCSHGQQSHTGASTAQPGWAGSEHSFTHDWGLCQGAGITTPILQNKARSSGTVILHKVQMLLLQKGLWHYEDEVTQGLWGNGT